MQTKIPPKPTSKEVRAARRLQAGKVKEEGAGIPAQAVKREHVYVDGASGEQIFPSSSHSTGEVVSNSNSEGKESKSTAGGGSKGSLVSVRSVVGSGVSLGHGDGNSTSRHGSASANSNISKVASSRSGSFIVVPSRKISVGSGDFLTHCTRMTSRSFPREFEPRRARRRGRPSFQSLEASSRMSHNPESMQRSGLQRMP